MRLWLLFWSGFLSLLSREGLAQRRKEGCFDRYALSCGDTTKDRVSLDSTVNAEEICTRLALEVFPTQEILIYPSLHAEYLNSIEANDGFCDAIRQVYHECFFCLDDDPYSECLDYAFWTLCADQPTREEILSNNDDYPLFQTNEDIDLACSQLEAAYAVEYLLKDNKASIPATRQLCMKQHQIKHLCPGYCPGGCFDGPTGRAPTCEPYPGPIDETVVAFEVCDSIHWDYFLFQLSWDDILNISTHQGHLKAIPGNSSECDAAQQSYSECGWCAKEKCFNDKNPVSCEAPDAPIDESINVEDICAYLHSPLDNSLEDGSRDFYNLSLHMEALWFGSNNTFCDYARQAYHKCYWCHQIEFEEEFCHLGSWCDSTATVPDDFVLPADFAALNLSAPEGLNCAQIYDLWNELWYDPYELSGCYRDIWIHRQCPKEFCESEAEERDQSYLGATTTREKKALVWMSRIAAFLSFGGASVILTQVLKSSKKRSSVYYQLVFAMAIFDVITAAAWVFATYPIDGDDPAAAHIYGASGTEATCKTQAFFVQLGFTSIFYNVSLALYYVAVVVYNRKEFQLKKLQYYLHGFPLLVGVGLSLGAIPRYHFMEYGCHILPPPEGDLWPVLVFVAIPLGFSIVAITVSVLFVYCKVRKQVAESMKWRMGTGKKSSSLESQVFWQCLSYLMAFYITWPILFSVYLASVDVGGPLGLTLTVAFVAPLQGFNNFLVFISPQARSVLSARSFSLDPLRRLVKSFRPAAISASLTRSKRGRNNDPTQGATAAARSAAAVSADTGTESRMTSSSAASRAISERERNKEAPSGDTDAAVGADRGTESGRPPPVPPPSHTDSGNDYVMTFADGTSLLLEDVEDMDPSALLPLRVPRNTNQLEGNATTENTATAPQATALAPTEFSDDAQATRVHHQNLGISSPNSASATEFNLYFK